MRWTFFNPLDVRKIVDLSARYLAANDLVISRAQAEQRMFEKLENRSFMADVRPLLSAEERERFDDAAARATFSSVFSDIIRLFPGAPWARTPELIARFALLDL